MRVYQKRITEAVIFLWKCIPSLIWQSRESHGDNFLIGSSLWQPNCYEFWAICHITLHFITDDQFHNHCCLAPGSGHLGLFCLFTKHYWRNYFQTIRPYWVFESVNSSARYPLANPFCMSWDFINEIFKFSFPYLELNTEYYKTLSSF